MGKTISIANYKGGVAKTTTAMNLGAALAARGRRVLLVDSDPQCNLTETLLETPPEETLYTAMRDGTPAVPVGVGDGLFLVPGDRALNSADYEFGGKEGAQLLIRGVLEPLKGRFDFILIDCPPSKQIVTVNALAASDGVIVPLLAEILSVRGLKDMSELVDVVREMLNPGLRIDGLLLTMYGDGTKAAKQTAVYIEEAAKFIGTRLFRTRIRKNVAVVESQMAGVDLFRLNPKANAAKDYAALADEVLAG